ncbi:MAG TPA: type II toxin-antitoxin system HipA family toxin [Steroidobacteraceae bacterium]|nr:type II toxin-antitoxin system HipA family toxin [Steroidobacteraceae bacterium]
MEVFLWGERIGVTVLDPRYNYYAFRYTPEFRQSGIEPAPLQMPVGADRTWLFTDLPVDTYRRLPALLSDALPDDFGNALINRWMADRGISAEDITPIDRLAYMSKRAMGALQFRPSRGPATTTSAAIQMSELVTEARKAVTGTIGNDEHANAALRSIIEVGTSAGGARAKAVVAWNPQTGDIRTGQLDAPPGFEHWLLKFDGMGKDNDLGAAQDYGRIEYAYHLMARAAGIRMSDCRLLEENGRAHFMTRRFDRAAGEIRHHVQTLCAMSHVDFRKIGTNSYSQLFDAASQLKLPYADREEVFRRMVFNVMGRNCDDHSKNFSFQLERGGAWTLAPAYDVTFAHSPTSKWTHQHLLAVNGKFSAITVGDMLEVADRFGIGTARGVIDQVQTAMKDWPEFAATAGVPTKQGQHIQDHLRPLST